MDKNSISFLSDLFNSYLIDKDSRFVSIASGLASSMRMVYAAITIPKTSAEFDQMLQERGREDLKSINPNIYNAVKWMLDYKLTTPEQNSIPALIRLGTTGATNDLKKILYTVFNIAKIIQNKEEILSMLRYSDVLRLMLAPNNLKALQAGTGAWGIQGMKADDNLKKELDAIEDPSNILNFFNVLQPGIADEPRKITSVEFENAFASGVEEGKNVFIQLSKNVPNVNSVIEQKIVPLMTRINGELKNYIQTKRNALTMQKINDFVMACYVVVALTTIGATDSWEMDDYYKIMYHQFPEWNKLPSLKSLKDKGSGRYAMTAKQAKELYRLISPTIIQRIQSDMPANYRQAPFYAAVGQGVISNPQQLAQYGIKVDMAYYGHAEIILEHVADKNVNTAANIILERIENFTHLQQTGKWPENVQPYHQQKTHKDISGQQPENEEENKQLEQGQNQQVQQNQENKPSWFNADIIKISSAILCLLIQYVNKQGNVYY